MKPIRVLHCPDIVAGNAQELARAEREIGLESVAVSFEPTPYGYETDEMLFKPRDGVVRRELKRLSFLRRALRNFDLVHFNFGRTIMPAALEQSPSSSLGRIYAVYARLVECRDLPLLKRAGKRIVVTYQGDDARQGDYSLRHFELSAAQEVEPDYYNTPIGDAARRRRIHKFARYADAIFALNPDLLRVLPERAEFLPYASVDVRSWTPRRNESTRPPVVLHAPSHRGVKGTRFVLGAVEALRAEGIEFEFTLIEGLTRDQARREYERADLLVDQLLVGWYGGLAVELMALGKPVIAYIRRDDLDQVPSDLRQGLPVIEARPETITDVLRRCLTTDRHLLQEVGARGRAYVERWHDPIAIAQRMKETYERILSR